jgi:hypothetical protein
VPELEIRDEGNFVIGTYRDGDNSECGLPRANTGNEFAEP